MLHIVKYLLEGLAVAMAAHLVVGKKLNLKEIVVLGVTAGMVFLILEHFTPLVGAGARRGAGFGIGYQLVNQQGAGEGKYEYYTDEVAVEATAEEAELTITDSRVSHNVPYKLLDGQYSAKILLAGFNDNAKAYNDELFVPNPWDTKQAGGATTPNTNPGFNAEQVPAVPAEEEATRQIESAPPAPVILKDNMYRQSNALYSGDLIDIITDGNYIQRGLIDTEIKFDKPLDKVGTNLSKLRVVNPQHSRTKQVALNYGEPVYIMHNAYYNNMNLSKYIKYGEKLQSHQDGPLFRAFKIYDANNKDKKGPIEPGSDIYICRGDQEGENIYLKVEADKTVTSKNTRDTATKFKITLKRVYETYDRNLCISPNEIIYP
jgi:hypothetical protein